MQKSDIQKLRDLPILGVAERLGLSLSHRRAYCPWHDDEHPSLTFNLGRNTCRCFACGNGGGTIDLVMRKLRLGFKDACKWLADENNVILTEYKKPETSNLKPETPFDASRYQRYFEHPWLSDQAKHFLFEERKLDPRVVRWCRLNSYKDWLQIPYYDQEGKLVGIQSRYLGKDKGQPRFRFPQGTGCHIYNLLVLKLLKPSETLFITEGSSDCWAMLSSGHKAIAIPSATLLKPSDVKPLETLNLKLGTTFKMFPDQDEPGERLFMQLKELLPQLEHEQLPKGCKDYSDYYLLKRKETGV